MSSEADRAFEETATYDVGQLRRASRVQARREPKYLYLLSYGIKSDLGLIREHNEDSFAIYIPDDPVRLATRGSLFVVADGMGGHAGGEMASQLTVNAFVDAYYGALEDDIPTAVAHAFSVANATVLYASRELAYLTGMGSTLVCAVLHEGNIFFANIGDSRGYLLRQGHLRRVTQDHTVVAEQVRAGLMSDEEARISPIRASLTRSIGIENSLSADIARVPARTDDVILLCSDGLTEHVEDKRIEELLVATLSPSEVVHRLTAEALSDGGTDNVTVLCVKIGGLIRRGWVRRMWHALFR